MSNKWKGLHTSMPRSRMGHAAVVVDGSVLLYGGTGASMFGARASLSGPPVRVVDAYNPLTRQWREVGSTLSDLRKFTATALPTGEVLLIALDVAECHSPRTGQSRPVAQPHTRRFGHAAALDGRGRVVIAAGFGAENSAELYESESGWREVGPLVVERFQPVAVTLADGRILITGGSDGKTSGLVDAEIFDPVCEAWTRVASMRVPRVGHTLTLLPNGSVLAIGGFDNGARHDTVECFDPSTGRWSPAGRLRVGRCDHAAAAVPDGRVLVAGEDGHGEDSFCEIFDPATGTSTAIDDPFLHGPAIAVVGSTVVVTGGDRDRALFLWTAL